MLMLIVHWYACIWYLIVNTQYQQDGVVWIPPMDLNNGETYFFDPIRTTGQQYIITIYYAILMVLGNEMGPKSLTQTLMASAMFIIGAMVLAFIFGSIAAAMTGAS